MAVERITPQLVKKGKGKKRPGYRGDAAYGRSSRSSQATSIGQARGATGKGGGASLGGGRDRNEQPAQQFIGGKSYNVTPETRGDRDRAQLKQQIMNQTKLGGNRIDKFGNTKKNLFRGGGGGIGSLLASLFGMAMGIPGLGLLTGGFGKLKEGLGSLNDKIQSTDFARSTSLMDYLDAKKYGGIDARDRKADQTMREARGIQTAMDMRPTTIDPREMARMGLQMPTAPMSKPTFSDPFRNTVGTTANTTNDAVSSNSIPTVNGVPMIDTGSVYQDNLNFFDNLNKGLVVNNEPPMVNTDNVMQGSVLDAQPKKGIMQMISDAFISPAGAADLSEDELNIQRALNAKSYKDTIKEVLPGNEITAGGIPDLSNPNVLNNIATSTGMPMEGFINKTPTTQTTRDIKSIQNYKRNPDLQFNVNDIMELDIGQRLGQPQIQSIYDMVRAPGQTPFLAADGGLASMFTRRG